MGLLQSTRAHPSPVVAQTIHHRSGWARKRDSRRVWGRSGHRRGRARAARSDAWLCDRDNGAPGSEPKQKAGRNATAFASEEERYDAGACQQDDRIDLRAVAVAVVRLQGRG